MWSYVLNFVPDFEVWVVNSGLEGERIVHLSPIQFSPSPHFQHKTETQCSVIVRLLTLHASLTSDMADMGQLEGDRGLYSFLWEAPLKYDDLMGNIFRRVNW